ncbi:MAG: ElyC/SanA/YdcF family protein, partial [Pseudomonadota bacterium]
MTANAEGASWMLSSGNAVKCRNNYWDTASRTVAILLFFAVAIPMIGLNFAESLLVKRQEARKSDVIVVLGGENKSRVEKVAELYKQKLAARVLVTGKNEDELIRKSLIASGVPEEAIWV